MEKLEISPRLSTNGLYAVRGAAVKGVGVCLASSWALADDLATGRLIYLLLEWQASPLPVSLVYRQARFHPARLRLFIDAMRTALPGAVASLK